MEQIAFHFNVLDILKILRDCCMLLQLTNRHVLKVWRF
jgi:hypothetical protein